jgi:hypothetical protein
MIAMTVPMPALGRQQLADALAREHSGLHDHVGDVRVALQRFLGELRRVAMADVGDGGGDDGGDVFRAEVVRLGSCRAAIQDPGGNGPSKAASARGPVISASVKTRSETITAGWRTSLPPVRWSRAVSPSASSSGSRRCEFKLRCPGGNAQATGAWTLGAASGQGLAHSVLGNGTGRSKQMLTRAPPRRGSARDQ